VKLANQYLSGVREQILAACWFTRSNTSASKRSGLLLLPAPFVIGFVGGWVSVASLRDIVWQFASSSLSAAAGTGSPQSRSSFRLADGRAKILRGDSASQCVASVGRNGGIRLRSASPACGRGTLDFPRIAVYAELLCCDKIRTFSLPDNLHGARNRLAHVSKQKRHSRNWQSPAVKNAGYAASAQRSDSHSACPKAVCVAFSCLSGGCLYFLSMHLARRRRCARTFSRSSQPMDTFRRTLSTYLSAML
jgi:hypothetical protein